MKIHTAPLLASLVVASVSAAASAESDESAELQEMIRAMQQTITEQNARIATLEKQQAAPEPEPVAPPSSPPPTFTPAEPVAAEPPTPTIEVADVQVPVTELPPAELKQEASAVRDADTFGDLQQAAPRVDNAPLDPMLKGFITIPGTDSIFRLGGSARLDAIVDFENNGNPNLFIPSTIPVPGQPGWDGGEHSTLHAKGTRLSLELRRPIPGYGSLRIYSEYDFFDDASSGALKFRARHFYGQAWNVLIGQTFTAFMDVDAFPDVVDYQGPNGIVNRRQPQVRYTYPLYDGANKMLVFASIEQPGGKIDTTAGGFPTGASVVNHVPDSIAGLRWEGSRGHVQASGIARQLSYETDGGPDDDTFGWGASLSGSLNIFTRDKLSAQATYGEGIARYVNDLGGESLDAAIDGGSLEPLPVFAAMVGYTHQWSDKWRSTLAGGYVQVDAPASLGGLAIDHTLYGSLNLMWHPTSSLRTGLEFLAGEKETANGAERDACRINFVIRCDLIR